MSRNHRLEYSQDVLPRNLEVSAPADVWVICVDQQPSQPLALLQPFHAIEQLASHLMSLWGCWEELWNSSIKEWWLVNVRDWLYRNGSTDSSIIHLRWVDFISVPAWMASTGSFPFNKEKTFLSSPVQTDKLRYVILHQLRDVLCSSKVRFDIVTRPYLYCSAAVQLIDSFLSSRLRLLFDFKSQSDIYWNICSCECVFPRRPQAICYH